MDLFKLSYDSIRDNLMSLKEGKKKGKFRQYGASKGYTGAQLRKLRAERGVGSVRKIIKEGA